MTRRYPPISPKLQGLIHGGDYNPEQWLHMPEVLAEDIRLMKLAGCNAMSVGIFSWSALEPEEGTFTFDWLDRVMDSLATEGIFAILATPTGSRPAWMSRKYPEVLRVSPERRRNLHGTRHNHCYTSPVYREKARMIDRKLAERYGQHPALILWHLSNEYGGECHCDLCQEAFRHWLKRRYGGDLGTLNLAWWTSFWSHTFTDWAEIESPAPHGEPFLPGLTLDWKRFVTDQTADFMRAEIDALKGIAPRVPVTTNMMGTYPGLNYWKLAPHLDVASLDSYPSWHGTVPDWTVAADTAFCHDLTRSLKGGRPFLLMESAPTFSNWNAVWKLKRPGMHAVTSLLAVAHGSDSVQYFQWRQGRGGAEKFHGAVVDHSGKEGTRVFGEISALGRTLQSLGGAAGTAVPAQTAIIFDWENRWSLEGAFVARAGGATYEETCRRHHRAFWNLGVPTDVIDMDQDFSRYRLVVAPMLSMVRRGVGERLEEFVRIGGTFVSTYWSGIVDENDLCFLGGFPGPLRRLLGLWAEETDGLYPDERNRLLLDRGNPLGMSGEYEVHRFCDLVHAETARVLGRYGDDFYAGRPAFTSNDFGNGRAFYIATDPEERFLRDFYRALTRTLPLRRAMQADLPEGVGAQVRTDGKKEVIFLLNFARERRIVDLGTAGLRDALTGQSRSGRASLEGYGFLVLEREASSE